MCKTHKIAKELEVTILKHLKGAEVLLVPEHGELPDGSCLVERDGEKFVLKTGGFDEHEVDDNWDLAEMGFRTRMVFETVPEEYILYEYIEEPVLANKEFWTEENLQKAFGFHQKLTQAMAERPISEEDLAGAIRWVEEKPVGKWLDEIAGKVYTDQQIAEIREIVQARREEWGNKDGMAWMYKDNNADRYIDLGDEIAMVHRSRHLRPRHYMDMRYLAWVILKMPDELLTIDWVKEKVTSLGGGPARCLTFLLSLIGILWDMHGKDGREDEILKQVHSKSISETDSRPVWAQNDGVRELVDKTDKIKEIVDWVMGEIKR